MSLMPLTTSHAYGCRIERTESLRSDGVQRSGRSLGGGRSFIAVFARCSVLAVGSPMRIGQLAGACEGGMSSN
jgi:hypothetical protein